METDKLVYTKYPRPIKVQITKADILSDKIFNSAGHMNNKLIKILNNDKTLFNDYQRLNNLLTTELLNNAQMMAPEMLDYIEATTAINRENIKFVESDDLFIEARKLTKKLQKTKNVFEITKAGSILNKSVTKQVDKTQIRVIKPNISRDGKWERHVNAGACDYCIEQIDFYESTGRWFRHANCRCFKVFNKGKR